VQMSSAEFHPYQVTNVESVDTN